MKRKSYKEYKVPELRKLCQELGLDETGNKPELIARLEKSDDKKIPMFGSETIEVIKPKIKLEKKVEPVSENLPTVDIYYLQLKSSNVSNYFNFGYIYPLALEESEIYKRENRAKDVLSIFEEHIVVSNGPLTPLEKGDVLLELVLADIPVIAAGHETEIKYVSQPIPISRVKGILFQDTEAKDSFLASIRTFPDSHIPEKICGLIPEALEQAKLITYTSIKLPTNKSLPEWRQKLSLFDKLLGLFGFIKNLSVLYSEKDDRFEEYSVSFLGVLRIINSVDRLADYKENLFLKPLIVPSAVDLNNFQRVLFNLIIREVYHDHTFEVKKAVELINEAKARLPLSADEMVDIQEIINLFSQLQNLNMSYPAAAQKEVMQKNLPALALLFLTQFPNKSRQNTDKQAVRNFFIECTSWFPKNKAEYILGILGLYYGYQNMIKEDTNLMLSDKTFKVAAQSKQSIKFKMSDYFERFIIESVFQFAVSGKSLNSEFVFLNWKNSLIEANGYSVEFSSSSEYGYEDSSYYLLGHKMTKILRFDKAEATIRRIAEMYADKVDTDSYIFAFIKKYIGFSASFLAKYLSEHKGKFPVDELNQILELDKGKRIKK